MNKSKMTGGLNFFNSLTGHTFQATTSDLFQNLENTDITKEIELGLKKILLRNLMVLEEIILLK